MLPRTSNLRYAGLKLFIASVLCLLVLGLATLPTGPWTFPRMVAAIALALSTLKWLDRSTPFAEPDFEEWSTAAQLAYAIPSSPEFRRCEDHQWAVCQIYRSHRSHPRWIAYSNRLPLPFVLDVLRLIGASPDDGAAGASARLRPLNPGPLAGAE